MLRGNFRNITVLVFLQTLLASQVQSQIHEPEIAWIRTYVQETEASRDDPRALLVDSSGNTYILAYVTNLVYGHSLLLLKFDVAGHELWRVEYTDGPGEETVPVTMRFDDTENIYILGHATQQGSILGIALLKYDRDGNQLRLTRYQETVPTSAVAMDFAPDGSVCIAGNRLPTDSDSDALTLKYDQDGQLVWTDTYDGAAGEDDVATRVAMGPGRSVYAVGRSETTSSSTAQVVSRRLDQNGGLLWERLHETRGTGDGPTGMAVDDDGNLLVLIRNQTFSEIIKYDSLGTALWTQQTHPPMSRASYANSLTLDSKRNIYVAGLDNSTTNRNYFTIKYDASGEEKWRATFEGGATDEAHVVAVDTSGNVYVAGTSAFEGETDFITVKYDSNGTQQWAQRFDAPDPEGFGSSQDVPRTAALANDGILVLGTTSADGPTGPDLAIVKHGFPDGEAEWSAVLNGPGHTQTAMRDLDIDGSDNIYVAGLRTEFDLSASYVAIKYSPQGVLEWEREYRADEELSNRLRAMAVDRAGNLVLGGMREMNVFDPGRTLDIVKLNTHGQQLWVFPLNLTQDMDDGTIYALEVAQNGTICFSSNDPVYALVSVSGEGLLNWVNSLSSSATIYRILFDDAHNVYVAGYDVDEHHVFLSRYDAGGDLEWSRQIEGAFISNSDAKFAALHGDHIYVTLIGAGATCLTTKYTLGGEQVWQAEYDPPSGGANSTAISVDQKDNILITGFQSVSGDREFVTIKYDSQGNEVWLRTFPGPAEHDNEAIAVSVDSVGTVTVTGQSSRGLVDDIETVQYSANGDLLWSHRYDSPAGRGDQVLAQTIDSAGDVIVMGYIFNVRFTQTGVFEEAVATTVIKYRSPMVSSVANPEALAATHWHLHNNYPNPFNPSTTITYSLPRRVWTRLSVYNLAGQRIRTLFEGESPAGHHKVEWHGEDSEGKAVASGIYFYKLEAGGFVDVKRMLLLR